MSQTHPANKLINNLMGSSTDRRRRGIYLSIAIVCLLAVTTDKVAATAKTVASKQIGACHIQQFGAYHALAEIALKADIAIGVDAIQPEEEPTVVLDFPGGTVSDLLNLFVSKVPDYQWQEGTEGIIHVSRRGAHVALLDVVLSYPGESGRTRQQVSEDISNIPEVGAWLRSNDCSRDQFSHGGEFRDHNGSLSIQRGHLTVRRLLDEIAVKSGTNYWAVLQAPASKPCRVTVIL